MIILYEYYICIAWLYKFTGLLTHNNIIKEKKFFLTTRSKFQNFFAYRCNDIDMW